MRVVSYWSGQLPDVSRLHFASFLARTTGAKYELFIENCDPFASGPDDVVRELQESGRLSIHTLPWESLSEMKVAPAVSVKQLRDRGKYADIVGPLFRRLASSVCRRFGKSNVLGLRGSFSAIGGFDFATDSRLFSWNRWHTYRADIFRVLAPSLFPGEDVLWVDLDTVFVRDFDEWPLNSSFVYRWEDQPHGNNAVIFFSEKSEHDRASLRDAAVTSRSFRPWVLFTDRSCAAIGFKILDPRLFDPAWDADSLMAAAPRMFTSSNLHSDEIVEQIERRCVVAHWHNQWRVTPEPGSPWSILMSRMTRENRTVRGG